MDRMRIGRFIAACRKEKGITQERLAEMLGVTGKSVSKWENGICLPDAVLYERLCAALEITISELFAGCRMKNGSERGTADEILTQMLKYKLYSLSSKDISFSEFNHALTQVSELTAQLKAFQTKDDAVAYMMEETHASYEICASAYDFYIGLFDIK